MLALSRYLIAFLVGSLLVPSVVVAQTGDVHGKTASPTNTPEVAQSPKTTPNEPAKAGHPDASVSCSRILDLSAKVVTDTSGRFKQLETNNDARGAKLSQQAATVAQKLSAARDAADTKRASSYKKLEDKVTTANAKQAVTTFETALTSAVVARRSAVDAADATFIKGIGSSVGLRGSQLKTAAGAYQTAVSNAVATAKASCSAGTAPATVRQTLITNLQAARANLTAARTAIDKLGPNADALKAARRAAVDAAEATFKTTVQAALATLRSGLSGAKATPSVSPSPHA